jgi:hypothetical protein
VRNLLGRGEARVAYSTQRSQRDAENTEKGFDGPAGRVPVWRRAQRMRAPDGRGLSSAA